MSHLTTIKTQFNDVDSLREAVESFGLKLQEGGTCRFYSGAPRVDYLIKGLPGNYDVGFNKNADGTLSIICDSEMYKPIYNGQKSEAYSRWGAQFEGLTTEYTAIRAAAIYRRKGYIVTREARQDGSVKLVAQRT